MILTREFSDKYVAEFFVGEEKKENAIKIIRQNSSGDKIIVTPNIETIDVETGEINND